MTRYRHRPKRRRLARLALAPLVALSLGGCTTWIDKGPMGAQVTAPSLAPESPVFSDLINLPPPSGRIPVSVYGFRDQTGQYKPAPSSSFSTAVTQGAASLLVKALLESGWFVPIERENLQDLLTERKIIRAATPDKELAPLVPASIVITGGVVGYDTNIKTGGLGARYFGIGAFEQYRMDQVTVNLRAVDVRTGLIRSSVSTTKTIYSYQLDSGVFRFVEYKRLLEMETGYTRNEPAQLCVRDAIQSAVIHLVVQGVREGLWNLKNPEDLRHPIVRNYQRAHDALVDQAAIAAEQL